MNFEKGRTKCFAIAGMVSTVACLTCDIVGLVTDEWQTREDSDSNNTSKAGLWTCTNEMCDRDEGRILASQVLGVIGAVMMAECMVVEGAMMMLKGFRKYGIWIFIAMDAFGFLCMVTEFAMYVNATAMEAADFGYSSILTVQAFLLSIVVGICCVLAYFGEVACTYSSYPITHHDNVVRSYPIYEEQTQTHDTQPSSIPLSEATASQMPPPTTRMSLMAPLHRH